MTPGNPMTFDHLVHIDRARSQPLYRQIAEQISILINNGRLPAGTQLPTVRQLADVLQVTRVTAQNAYSELQADGWVESTVGRGTFVIAQPQGRDLINVVGKSTTADAVMGNI